MMEQQVKVEQLIDQILEEYQLTPIGDISVEVTKEDNTFDIHISGKVEDDEFNKYLQNMDDELFQEVCERFEEETGITLNDFAHDVNPALFKQVVSKICREKIMDLTKFILE